MGIPSMPKLGNWHVQMKSANEDTVARGRFGKMQWSKTEAVEQYYGTEAIFKTAFNRMKISYIRLFGSAFFFFVPCIFESTMSVG